MVDDVTIVWPSVDVARLGRVMDVAFPGLERLWEHGRIRSLTESPEGLEAMKAFEESRLDALAQWTLARAAGKKSFTLRIVHRSDGVRAVFSLTRQLMRVLSDPETMRAVGAEPLQGDELQYMDELLRYGEGMIGLAGPPLA